MAIIKRPDEIERMRESGRILGLGMQKTLAAVEPGVSTNELDAIFLKTIRALGGAPSFFGYKGYPKAICTSVNDEVVHAIPSDRVLQEGDIIGVDCGVRFEGYCTDMARTVPVGNVGAEELRLIEVTAHALQLGIAQLHPSKTIGDIGAAVQTYVEQHGFHIVRALVGHGVGEAVHEEPSVPNYGKPGTGRKLEAGMILAVEPMVNMGTVQVEFDEEDGWTVRTADQSRSAHFEDTILITDHGPDVLTVLP